MKPPRKYRKRITKRCTTKSEMRCIMVKIPTGDPKEPFKIEWRKKLPNEKRAWGKSRISAWPEDLCKLTYDDFSDLCSTMPITHGELAKRLGCDQRTICNWKRGLFPIHPLLARALLGPPIFVRKSSGEPT